MQENQKASENFREWRGGRTQAEVADLFGVTVKTISALETERKLPSLALAGRIEKLTGIPASSWVRGDQPLAQDISDGAEAHAS